MIQPSCQAAERQEEQKAEEKQRGREMLRLRQPLVTRSRVTDVHLKRNALSFAAAMLSAPRRLGLRLSIQCPHAAVAQRRDQILRDTAQPESARGDGHVVVQQAVERGRRIGVNFAHVEGTLTTDDMDGQGWIDVSCGV